MSGSSRWDRVVEIFAEAALIPAGERAVYVHRQTDDPRVRREVLSLLAVETPSADILERSALEWYLPRATSNAAVEEPLPRLLSGEVIAGRFYVRAFLGRGGMGEVYAADDRELGESVALKLLRPEFSAEPAFVTRFRREIRLARRISHPNVARVFDLVQEPTHPLGPLHIYVMELLEGQTLALRLRRGASIPLAEAVGIARQLAAGLRAAHTAGVIHRDFKPSNVVLLEGRAVITDFGLAAPIRPGTEEAQLRTTSMLLGTPGYIAPEQWAGQPASVASDVYAFGVVLHELITGSHPNNSTGIKPPPTWEFAIRKCLEVDPRNRWRSPTEAAAALDSKLFSRRNAVLATAVAGSVSLGALLLRPLIRGIKPSRGSKLMVAEFQNTTDDSRFDAMGTALRMQLDQSTYFNVVEPSQISAALQRMLVSPASHAKPQQYREAAWRMNASTLVFGTVAYVGTLPNLTIQVEWRGSGPQTPSNQLTKSFAARSTSDLIALAREAANWIRESAGDSSHREAQYDRLPEDVTTASWEALSYYAKAEQFAALQSRDEALLQLDSALRVDPSFTLAATRRADILNSQGRELEAISAWQDVLRLLRTRTISRREELRALGMSSFDCGDYAEADRRFAQWASEYPTDARGFVYRAFPLLMSNRAEELRSAINTAVRLDPDFFTAHVHQCCCAIVLGDRALLDRHAIELRRLEMSHFADLMESLFCFARADFEGVRYAARKLRTARLIRFQHEAFLRDAMVFGESGRMDLAALSLKQGLALPRETSSSTQRSTTLIGLAYCGLATQGSYLQDWLEEAISLRTGPTTLTHAVIVSTRAKRLGDAKKYLTQLHQLPPVPKCEFGAALADAESLSAAGKSGEAAAKRILAGAFTAPYHASPQATSSGESLVDQIQKQAYAAALLWIDPFLPELGAWGRRTRLIQVSASDARPDGQKLFRFQTTMQALSSNPQKFTQPGDLS
jgi:serine/threonine protein kinase/tetratricopeptide (TPR) repeat protein